MGTGTESPAPFLGCSLTSSEPKSTATRQSQDFERTSECAGPTGGQYPRGQQLVRGISQQGFLPSRLAACSGLFSRRKPGLATPGVWGEVGCPRSKKPWSQKSQPLSPCGKMAEYVVQSEHRHGASSARPAQRCAVGCQRGALMRIWSRGCACRTHFRDNRICPNGSFAVESMFADMQILPPPPKKCGRKRRQASMCIGFCRGKR